MPGLAAVILAGGLGERLGGARKASLKVGGTRLIDRVHAALSDAQPILVSSGPTGLGPLLLPDGTVSVPDLLPESKGPIAGLAAAVARLLVADHPPEIVVCAAVDTPFLPQNFAARMRDSLAGGALAAVAQCDGQDYPTNSAWRLAVLADLPRRVLAGRAPASLRKLAAELAATPVDWSKTETGDPFSNVNTLEDLMNLERRLQSSTASRK